jgi:hypothetical protein
VVRNRSLRVEVCLRLSTTLVATLLFTGAARAGQVYAEEFAGTGLGAEWAWQNPSGNASFWVSGGTLNLSVGRNSDQWVQVDRAPRLLKEQRSTKWTIETRITANSGAAFTFAGLVIYRDRAHWLLWGQSGLSSLEASGIVSNASTRPLATMSTRFPYLRIRRTGRVYSFDASPDGVNWTNGNVFEDRHDALEGARIGLMAKTWGNKVQYQVEFDYFREVDADLMPTAIKGIASTELIAQETGDASLNQTRLVDFCGGDLGELFDWNGKTFVVFGDTFGCNQPKAWRANTMAYTTDTRFDDGLLFDGWIKDSQGRAKELFAPDRGTITAIPTSGVGTAEAAYLFYMQVTDWKTWSCNLSSIASASACDPETWTKHTTTIQWSPGNFNMVAVLKYGHTLYVYGTPCGRTGSIKLMMVEERLILQKGAYRYFSGFSSSGPTWSPSESAAVDVAGGPAGEVSVRWNEWLGRFVMTYLDEPKGLMVVREAPRPWGPWSAPVPIARYEDYPKMYGAFMKPGYEENRGQSLYFVMSLHGPYNTYWMKTTFAP